MFEKFKMSRPRLTSNQVGILRLAQLFAILVIVGVVGYCEVMFLQVIGSSFPDGFFKTIAMIGGVSTGLSVLTLLLAKAYWFRPGGQMVASWAFTGVEVLILLLNVLLSFDLATHHNVLPPGDALASWYTLCPSSPLFALVGWTILLMLDRSQKERHDHMEMEDEVRQMELEHQRAVHGARMRLKTSLLDSHVSYLEQHVNSSEMQEDIKTAARLIANEELSSFVGRHIAAMHHSSSAAPVSGPSTGPLDLPSGTPDGFVTVTPKGEQKSQAQVNRSDKR